MFSVAGLSPLPEVRACGKQDRIPKRRTVLAAPRGNRPAVQPPGPKAQGANQRKPAVKAGDCGQGAGGNGLEGGPGRTGKKQRRMKGKKALRAALVPLKGEGAHGSNSKKGNSGAKDKGTGADRQKTQADPKDAQHSGTGKTDGAMVAGDAAASGNGRRSLGGVDAEAKAGGVSRCDGCGQALRSQKVAGDQLRVTFREHGGRKYCERCFAANIAPSCARYRCLRVWTYSYICPYLQTAHRAYLSVCVSISPRLQ